MERFSGRFTSRRIFVAERTTLKRVALEQAALDEGRCSDGEVTFRRRNFEFAGALWVQLGPVPDKITNPAMTLPMLRDRTEDPHLSQSGFAVTFRIPSGAPLSSQSGDA